MALCDLWRRRLRRVFIGSGCWPCGDAKMPTSCPGCQRHRVGGGPYRASGPIRWKGPATFSAACNGLCSSVEIGVFGGQTIIGDRKTEKPPWRRLIAEDGRRVRRGPPSSPAAGSIPGRWSSQRVRWSGCVSFSWSSVLFGCCCSWLTVRNCGSASSRSVPIERSEAFGEQVAHLIMPALGAAAFSAGRDRSGNSEAFRGAGRLFAVEGDRVVNPRRGGPVR